MRQQSANKRHNLKTLCHTSYANHAAVTEHSTCLVLSLSQPGRLKEPVASTLVRHDAVGMISPTAVVVVVLS